MTFSEYDPTTEIGDSTETDWNAIMRSAGWEPYMTLGSTNGYMWVSTWQRTRGETTEYCAELSNPAEGSPLIRTDSFLELTDLLARWAPIIQAEAITNLIAELDSDDLSSTNLVGRIAAKVLDAENTALPDMRRQRAEEAERLRTRRLARRTADQ